MRSTKLVWKFGSLGKSGSEAGRLDFSLVANYHAILKQSNLFFSTVEFDISVESFDHFTTWLKCYGEDMLVTSKKFILDAMAVEYLPVLVLLVPST